MNNVIRTVEDNYEKRFDLSYAAIPVSGFDQNEKDHVKVASLSEFAKKI